MMHTSIKSAFLALAVAATLSACRKDADPSASQPETPAANFDYSTTRPVTLRMNARHAAGTVFRATNVEIFGEDPTVNPNAQPLAHGLVNSTGLLEQSFPVPSRFTKLYIRPNYPGLLRIMEVPVQSQIEINAVPQSTNGGRLSSGNVGSGSCYTWLGSYSDAGVPSYLEATNRMPSAHMMSAIATALPERVDITLPTHPRQDLVTPNVQTNLPLTDSADVYMTFIGEGAAFLNSVGYFVFDPNNKPTSASQIAQKTIAWPNASFSGDGGGLVVGNTIKLGRFPGGKAIGWFIVSDGYKYADKNVKCNESEQKFYSIAALNPEPQAADRAHTIQMYDETTGRVVIGFEDLRRDWSSDDDFNDVLFFATVTPVRNCNYDNIPPLDPCTDTDGDGICDDDEDYPNDPTLAKDNKYTGSLAFEDLWPSKGDYDFNDLVVQYEHNVITNAEGKAKKMKLNYTIKAIGASFRNGFGLQLPVPASNVSAATGSRLFGTATTLAANGTEVGNTQATLIAFDDAHRLVSFSGAYYNTIQGQPGTSTTPVNIDLTFNTPVAMGTLGASPWNPFIFVNQFRAKEVHLVNHAPTQLATIGYFGQDDDRSHPNAGKYYIGSNNLPWALHLPVTFEHPIERADIHTAYLKFGQWAASNGSLYPDWYLNLSGYRDNSKIFQP